MTPDGENKDGGGMGAPNQEPEKRWVVGRTVGDPEKGAQYKLLKQLGKGGFGLTFIAHRKGPPGTTFGKEVCLKVLRPDLAAEITSDSKQVEINVRMLDEATLGAAVRHDNLVDIYNFLNIEGDYVIEMQFVHGITLASYINSFPDHQVPLHAAVYVTSRILRGAAWMHGAVDCHGEPLNLVHRDLKPGNVFLDLAGAVKIGDFGLAKGQGRQFVTRDQQVRGTTRYMSPEQVRPHSPMDGKADVYSIGVMLYQMLAGGRHPARHHEVHNEYQAHMATLGVERVPLHQYAPHVPEDVCRVIDSMVACDPVVRPTADEARRLLLRAVRIDLVQQEDDLQTRVSTITRGRSVPTVSFGAAQEPTDFVSLVPEASESGVQPRSPAPRAALAVTAAVTPEVPEPQASPHTARRGPKRILGASIITLAVASAVVLGLRHEANIEQPKLDAVSASMRDPVEPSPTQVGTATEVPTPQRAVEQAPLATELPPSTPRVEGQEPPPKPLPTVEKRPETLPQAPTPATTQKATLHIVAVPRGNVWIDGKLVGQTPLTKRLAPGDYTVEVGADKPAKAETVSLRAGQKKNLQIEYHRLFE